MHKLRPPQAAPIQSFACFIPSFAQPPQASHTLSYSIQAFRSRWTPCCSLLRHFSPVRIIAATLLRSHCLSALRATFPRFALPFRTPYSLADAPLASLYIAIDHLADIARFPRFPISLAGLVQSPLDPFSLAELSAAPRYSALPMPSLHTLFCYTL
jgi:hypothetical protein